MPQDTPAKIGRYKIHEELGRGMMGVVYRAHDTLLDRTVALKTIRLAMVISPEEEKNFEQRFFTEAQSAGRLSHPGIVVVHDIGRDSESGTLFMALEYLNGQTLSDLAARGERLEWREALRIVARVAEALHHAHGHGIVHRDIKPANVMVLDTGEPKIMDFGIAKVTKAQVQLTSTGQFFGTPLFMAPEQALGQPVDGRSDLFSLGSVAYQLLTGVRPFEAENVPRILARVAYESPEPVSSLTKGLPADVDYLVERALAKPPEDRYSDGQSFAEDIGDILEGRAPRHRAAWNPRKSGTGTLADAERPPPEAPPGKAPTPSPHAAQASWPGVAMPPPPVRKKRLWPAGLLAAVVLIGGLGIAGLAALYQTGLKSGDEVPVAAAQVTNLATPNPAAARRSPTPASTPEPTPVATATPAPTPRPTPVPRAPATPAPSHLALLSIDLEHPFERGLLKLWLDKKLILEREFAGEVTQDLLVAKIRKGRVESALAIPAGFHDLWVEVRWDENQKRKAKGISAAFKAGESRNLRVRVGRIRKNLSLDWQ